MTTEEFKRDILRLQPRLQRTAESIIGEADSAADAVQEAVITLWEQHATIKSQDMAAQHRPAQEAKTHHTYRYGEPDAC